MNDLDAGFLFNRLLRGWWLLALGMLLGGAAGWGFSQLQPPVYEAVAFFQVEADESALLERFGLASPDELDFQKINTLLQPVEDLFFAPDVRQQVMAGLAAAGIPPEDGNLDEQTFILDRRGSTWLVTVRDRDPDRAVRTADIWLETVANRLEEFQSHAVNAEILRVQYSLVAACFSGSTFPDANLCAGTALASQSELEVLLERARGPDGRRAGGCQGCRCAAFLRHPAPGRGQPRAHAVCTQQPDRGRQPGRLAACPGAGLPQERRRVNAAVKACERRSGSPG